MKTLLILRHAKSSHDHPGLTDRERPLNKRGRHDAPLVGELLAKKDLIPERILSSNAVRTQETTSLVVEQFEEAPPIELRSELYLAPSTNYIHVLGELNDKIERVMVVGHNPGLHAWVEMLGAKIQNFPTAALAVFELDIASWRDLAPITTGTLKLLWFPKEAE